MYEFESKAESVGIEMLGLKERQRMDTREKACEFRCRRDITWIPGRKFMHGDVGEIAYGYKGESV